MPGNKLTIGNVEITSLSDGLLEFDLCNFFPAIPEDDWHGHEAHLSPSGGVRFNLACFVIRSEGRTIAVDTGLGPKPTPETPWGELLNDFAAHGMKPEDVDMVVMTHAHRDHIGWNVVSQDGKYVPTFPNARYYVSARDWEACHDPALIETRFPQRAGMCLAPRGPGRAGVDGERARAHQRVDYVSYPGPHPRAHEHNGLLPGRKRSRAR